MSIKGKRKLVRVLDRNVNLYSHRISIRKFLFLYAKKFGVTVYKESVQKDHFHFCIKITNRPLYRAFIRSLTGVISQKLGKGLWILAPYSRVVTWGRDFVAVLDYILLNDCEVSDRVPYAIRAPRRKLLV